MAWLHVGIFIVKIVVNPLLTQTIEAFIILNLQPAK